MGTIWGLFLQKRAICHHKIQNVKTKIYLNINTYINMQYDTKSINSDFESVRRGFESLMAHYLQWLKVLNLLLNNKFNTFLTPARK